MIFRKKIEIGLKDILTGNKVRNKSILEYLENVAEKHSSSIGYGVTDIENTKRTWVLLEWKVQIKTRPTYKDVLTVATWARQTTRCTSYRDFEIYDSNNNLLVIATSKWVLIDVEKERPIKIENELIEKYKPEYEKLVFNTLNLEDIEFFNKVQFEKNFIARRCDIDINGHMHNLNYLDYAYEVLPYYVFENIDLKNIRITYKKQIKLGEEFKCQYIEEGDKNIIIFRSEDNKYIYAIIELKN